MARPKKPKVKIKRTKSSLGWTDPIYIDDNYMDGTKRQHRPAEGAKRMLAIQVRQRRRESSIEKIELPVSSDRRPPVIGQLRRKRPRRWGSRVAQRLDGAAPGEIVPTQLAK